MAEQLKNQWLIQNNRPFQGIKRLLVEYDYKGLDELPSRTIQAMMESAIIEIGRMQRELDAVNEKVKLMESQDTVTKKDGE